MSNRPPYPHSSSHHMYSYPPPASQQPPHHPPPLLPQNSVASSSSSSAGLGAGAGSSIRGGPAQYTPTTRFRPYEYDYPQRSPARSGESVPFPGSFSGSSGSTGPASLRQPPGTGISTQGGGAAVEGGGVGGMKIHPPPQLPQHSPADTTPPGGKINGGLSKKKRPRASTTSEPIAGGRDEWGPKDRDSTRDREKDRDKLKDKSGEKDKGEKESKPGLDRQEDLPSVLIREKKQKACANCRRAKLKCIVEDGQEDCVRCRARKEKCVFYPRSHDEDWQQILTSDVYASLRHLSTLTHAVQHILYHLQGQQVIPPLPPHPENGMLESYEAPDRDSLLQGWGARKNQELPANAEDRRRKRKARGEEDDDDDDDAELDAPRDRESMHGAGRRDSQMSNGQISGPGLFTAGPEGGYPPHIPPQRPFDYPPPPSAWNGGPNGYAQPYPGPPPPPPPPGLDHRHSVPDLPSLRSSSFSMPRPSPVLQDRKEWPGSNPSTMPPPPPLPRSYDMPYPTGPPGPGLRHSASPNAPPPQHVITPGSIVASSPAMGSTAGSGLTPGVPVSSISSAPGSHPADPRFFPSHPSDPPAAGPPPTDDAEQAPFYPPPDMDPSVIPGSADGRQNVITKRLVHPRDAVVLIDYFHSHLAPCLYGYTLQPNHFPYLSEGPTTVTPFILGVICLLASEHVPHLRALQAGLSSEIEQLLAHGPAESWQNFKDSQGHKRQSIDPGKDATARRLWEGLANISGGMKSVFGFPIDFEREDEEGGGSKVVSDDGEDVLDPELGLGPEEIVAATVLATFMSEKKEALRIAATAFRWARGWIRLLNGPPRLTFAESSGLVPTERIASDKEQARVWLLCYVVEGTEVLRADIRPPPRLDPIPWCNKLIPPDDSSPAATSASAPSPAAHPDPQDVLLTYHARLITLLRDWNHRRYEIDVSFGIGPGPGGGGVGGGSGQGVLGGGSSAAQPSLGPRGSTALGQTGTRSTQHRRLAANTNAQLEMLSDSLESYRLARHQTAQIELFFLFARVVVNDTCASQLAAQGQEGRLKLASCTMGVESGLKYLERIKQWKEEGGDVLCLPPCYFFMMVVLSFAMLNALKEASISPDGGAWCPVTAADVLPLMQSLVDTLTRGDLPETHGSRQAAISLKWYCEELEKLF